MKTTERAKLTPLQPKIQKKFRVYRAFGTSRRPAAFFLFFLVFCLALVSLAACSSQGGRDERRVTVRLSTWGGAEEMAVLKSLLGAFERENPDIRVDLMHIPDNYYQKLHILVAGGMTPDVVFTNSISFPVYASHHVFRDLRPFLAKSKVLSEADFYPAARLAFTWPDASGRPELLALPRDISNLVVFYNASWFRRAGATLPVPGWTWEDFSRTAGKLTDASKGRFGVSFYRAPPLFWMPFVWSAGGELFSRDFKTFVPDRENTLRGLAFYADLRNRLHVAPRQEESGGATMSQLFLQEKIAMMVNGRWSVPVLRTQAKFDWDVAPLPVGPSGSRVGIDASGYAMSASTPYPEQSWRLIAFLLSRASVTQVTRSGLIVPARPDVASSPAFLGSGQPPTHGKVFTDVIATGVPTHTPPRWNEISEELMLALDPVWNGKTSPEEALESVRPRIQRILDVGAR